MLLPGCLTVLVFLDQFRFGCVSIIAARHGSRLLTVVLRPWLARRFRNGEFRVCLRSIRKCCGRQRPVQNSELCLVSALGEMPLCGPVRFACHVATMLRPATASQ